MSTSTYNLKNRGGGGGGGSGLDYIILLSQEGGVGSLLRLIGEGGKKCQKNIT